ncbi:MAG: bacteriocin [Elainellaceae cyanobacterium]
MTEQNIKQEQELNDEQLNTVSGGLSGRHREEFFEGLGNKGLSERHREEFHEGLGNKGLSERHSEEFYEGLGNK